MEIVNNSFLFRVKLYFFFDTALKQMSVKILYLKIHASPDFQKDYFLTPLYFLPTGKKGKSMDGNRNGIFGADKKCV